MRSIKKPSPLFLALLLLGGCFFFVQPGLAQDNPFQRQLDFGDATPQAQHPIEIAEQIIKIALSLVGLGTTILMLYAGVKWMTAGGNEDAVATAKKTLRNSLIGLILIMMAYALTLWVTRTIQREAGNYGVGGGAIGGSATIGDGLQGSAGIQQGGVSGSLDFSGAEGSVR